MEQSPHFGNYKAPNKLVTEINFEIMNPNISIFYRMEDHHPDELASFASAKTLFYYDAVRTTACWGQ